MLMVGHLLEYHPGVRKLKELADSGELGERIYYIYGNRLNLGKLRADENALWSLGAHDVSVVLHLAGEEPWELVAHGESYVRPGVEDVVFCFLRFPSGLSAHLHLSWLDPHKERRFTVVGSRRMATFDDMALEGKVTIYDKGFDEDSRGYGEYITRSGGMISPPIPNVEPLRVECEHFVECVRERAPATVRRRERAARRAGARGAAALAGRRASVPTRELAGAVRSAAEVAPTAVDRTRGGDHEGSASAGRGRGSGAVLGKRPRLRPGSSAAGRARRRSSSRTA